MQRTWIFQANPDQFDIDRFLAASPADGKWRVSNYAAHITVGDAVFLWRSVGSGEPRHAGIIAEAKVTHTVVVGSDDSNTREYWRDRSDAARIEPRVPIVFYRIAATGKHLTREDIKQDPILSRMHVVRAPLGTNFSITDEEAGRLRVVWEKAHTPWTRTDLVLGLQAYDRRTEKTDLAIQLGRLVSEARKLLAEFKGVDPRESLASMTARKGAVYETFREFYCEQSGQLRHQALERAATRV